MPKDMIVMIMRLILLLHHLGQLSTAQKRVRHVAPGMLRL